MKKIMVAVDGSEQSLRAVKMAATLAAQTGQCHTDPQICNERYTATLSSPASEGTCIFATPAPDD